MLGTLVIVEKKFLVQSNMLVERKFIVVEKRFAEGRLSIEFNRRVDRGKLWSNRRLISVVWRLVQLPMLYIPQCSIS